MKIDPDVKLWLIPPFRRTQYGAESMRYLLEAYGRKVWLRPSYGAFVAISITNPGRKWKTGELVELVWSDPDNEPESPEFMISLILTRLKKKLAKHGLEFVMTSGRGREGRRFFGIRPFEDCLPPSDEMKAFERTDRHLEPV